MDRVYRSQQGSNSSQERGFRHKAVEAGNGGMPVAKADYHAATDGSIDHGTPFS
jgi:hypothetical protein